METKAAQQQHEAHALRLTLNRHNTRAHRLNLAPNRFTLHSLTIVLKAAAFVTFSSASTSGRSGRAALLDQVTPSLEQYTLCDLLMPDVLTFTLWEKTRVFPI